MKLIRTLIDTKKSEKGEVPLRPSQIAQKPITRPSVPVSSTLAPRSVMSENMNIRLKKFKNDLAELAPLHSATDGSRKPKRVWDLEAEARANGAQTTRPDESEEAARPSSTPASAPKDTRSEHAANTLSAEDDTSTQPLAEPEGRNKQRPITDLRPDRKASALRMFEVPNPLQPKRALTVGRTKTRIMGFAGDASPEDLFDIAGEDGAATLEFPVGWLVITKGPGRGKSFILQNPVSSIGRAVGQTITLNFGDDTISRNNHAAVAYDDQMNTCFLGYGGKANLVRLNGRPVLATEQLSHGDVIRVGETDLKFIALCGPDFAWDDGEEGSDD